ncbi:MAG TPA: DUF1553 domain-containing protein [Planctomycetes bacterium]|nr:DUF1553 domain-containing protein [Planctomycetota bacterium]
MKIPPACLALLLTSAAIPVLFAVSSPITISTGTADTPVDFARVVRPILSEHCFPCHGPNEESRKAGLSLVDFESATSELEDGATAIVPGSRKRSAMWLMITDPEDPMPPPEENNELNLEQIEILGRWIDEGADYTGHWAYLPGARTPVPAIGDSDWAATDIDHFILERLLAEGLRPVPDTDAVTLLRRLSYDLTGLPPATEDVDRFLSDSGDSAYSDAVDRLLASRHFGERLTSSWLDLVRYADTVGYHGDQEHRVWPYRDWVIAAFNANMPFDRFTIEQIAGDLLENPNQEQLIASCYNRLLQTTHEGGLQLGEYRAIYMADRVRNLAEVWMGATLGCAQCHDHKYDPFTMRDFYSFGAFFADVDDEDHIRNPYGGLNTTPTRRAPELRVVTDEARESTKKLSHRIDEAEDQIEAAIADLEPLQERWEADLRALIASGEAHQSTWVDDRLDTGGESSGRWNFVREESIPPHSGELYRKQMSDGLVQHYTHETTEKRITVEEGDLLFAWVYLLGESSSKALMLQCNTSGNWEHRAVWGGDEIGYGRKDKSWAGYRRLGALPPSGQWTRLEVPFAEIGISPGTIVNGVAFTQFGGTTYWDRCGVENVQAAPAAVIETLSIPVRHRNPDQRAQLRDYQANQSEDVIALRATKASLETEISAIEKSLPLTLYTRSLDSPRQVRILPRGNWLDSSGAIVEPAIPAFLGKLAGEGRASRLDLARWLVTDESAGGVGSLTARVFVNRVWSLLFGTGLCPSVEDFGGQGRPPTHPELLDHLALEFIDSGWDIKALFRRLVHSRTYRQSSIPDERSTELDPENLLYSHQARFRLPAEMVRDTLLAVSGLLVDQPGGPSVKPPQPEHYYRHLNFPPRKYHPDMNAQQWRRGVYVHWQRQYLHPMFLAFDAPTREDCAAQRTTSNTPLAALVLLNDPTFVEAARGFAQHILARVPKSDQESIAFAMKKATCRQPTAEEIAVLAELLAESREHFKENPIEAKALLAVGRTPVPKSIEPVELAAWTEVTRAILNLHETITRE